MSFPSPVDIGFDGHVHTSLCNHAMGTMEEYVLCAIKKQLHTICFLEHLEVGISQIPRTWLTPDDFSFYFSEGLRLKEKYKDRITILLGVEAGYNPEAESDFLAAVTKYPWDRIGLSCHFLKIGSEYFNVLSKKKETLEKLADFGPEKVTQKYYQALDQALQSLDRCDVVCHLDAVLRHLPQKQKKFSEKIWSLIFNILTGMEKKKVALEINTSGFALRNEPFPTGSILKPAMEKGIQLVLGSDAHTPEQVGRFFPHIHPYLATL